MDTKPIVDSSRTLSNRPLARWGRRGSVYMLVLALAAVTTLILGGVVSRLTSPATSGQENHDAPTANVSTASPTPTDPTASGAPKLFPTTIGQPAGPPKIATGENDAQGNPIGIACSTCHNSRKPNPENRLISDLDEFHRSMKFTHGTVSCLSCHNSTDYDALKLADGRRVEFTDVMTLCAQCHGPQMRDYNHGAHGGMNGHWDLTRGPRTKNNCIDCHNPHSPQFPKMQPTFKPRDRFLEKATH